MIDSFRVYESNALVLPIVIDTIITYLYGCCTPLDCKDITESIFTMKKKFVTVKESS